MAELAEWSAQVLRCQGSDVPVKVVYIQSSEVAETSDSFYRRYHNHGWPKECPESGKQISHHASGVSDFVLPREEATTREPFSQYYRWRNDLGEISPQASGVSDFLSGQFFHPEVLDPKNYIWQRKELFEDIKSALEAFLSTFKNRSRVVPFDPEANYAPKSSYAKPRFIEPSKEDDLLLYLLMCAIDEKRLKQSKHIDKGKEEEEKGEEKKQKEDSRKQKGGDGGELERKIETIEEKEKKQEKEIKEKPSARRKKLDEMAPPGASLSKLYALISGIITEFNPSGMWIVEEFFNDEEEVK